MHNFAEVLPPLFFFLEPSSISLHLYPTGGMSEVILNLVPKKKKYKGVRTSAIQQIKLQNYLPEENFSPVRVKY
jgi:hypothetical protein